MIDQYLSDQNELPKQEIYGIKDLGSGADVVLQGLEEPTNMPLEIQEQETLDVFEHRMA